MFNERAFIARVEEAGPEELARLLTNPSVAEEKALRAHLGDQRYQRMHSMALKRNISRSVGRAKKGNVLVIHGIMGAELSVSSGPGAHLGRTASPSGRRVLTDWKTFQAASERPEMSFELRTPLKRGFSVSPRRNWSLNNVSLLLDQGATDELFASLPE